MRIKIKRAHSFLITLVFLSIMGCSDSDLRKSETIIGTWSWYQSSGGFAGGIQTPETTGETRKVVFEKNGNVTFYTNDVITLSSTYTLSEEKTMLSVDPLPVVKVEAISFFYVYSFPYANELELEENITDGYIHNYSR